MNPKNKTERTIDRVSGRLVDDLELLLDQLRFFKARRATLNRIIANIERRLAFLAGQSKNHNAKGGH